MPKRRRKIFSVKNELIQKSREAMLTAVQIFNNPNIHFKSESFVVLSIISWTYLLHAYYREHNIEYRYFEQKDKKRVFCRTKNKAYKYWELERCLDEKQSPIDKTSALNLRFLIGLRHEIEHQMTTRIDDLLSGRFQATCLNYNHYLKSLFGKNLGIEKYLSFSLQFSAINEDQVDQLADVKSLPENISTYIEKFDDKLSDDDFNDSRFSYRIILLKKTVNHKGQADRVIEFIAPNSKIAETLNKEYWGIKEKEKKKYRPQKIWKEMQKIGFKNFGQYQHTLLWKKENAKELSKNYGVDVEGTWYWYVKWYEFVKKHCIENKNLYI